MNLFYDCTMIPILLHSFAEKKMRTVLILLMMFPGMICNGRNINKNMAGVEVSAALKEKCMKVSFHHGMSEKWSIGAAVSINMKGFATGKDMEMTEHENEFGETGSSPEETGMISDTETIMMQFWPAALFEGMYIMVGGRHMHDKGVDCVIGLGYMLPVWKGLSAVVSLETGLIHPAVTSAGEGITFGISYKF